MIRKLFISFISGCLLITLLQAESVSYLRKIKWTVIRVDSSFSSNPVLPSFFGATYRDTADYPFYTEVIAIPAGKQVSSVTLQHTVYQPYTPVFTNIPDTAGLSWTVVSARKKKFLQISFPAVTKSRLSPANALLTKFILQIVYTPVKKSLHTEKSWTDHSVLSQGKWIKIRLKNSGIHKISYDELKAWGISDPEHPRIFGNGGMMIPEMNSDPQPDDLKEIPVRLVKGSDGVFNQGDFLLFYAEGPVTWRYDSIKQMFVHQKHLYDDSTSYFITSGTVKEIPDAQAPSGMPGYLTGHYDDYRFHEDDLENPIKSGREWYEPIAVTGTSLYNFDFIKRDNSQPVKLLVRYIGRSASATRFSTFINGIQAGTLSVQGVNLNSFTTDYGRARSDMYSMITAGDNIEIGINMSVSDPFSSRAWVDYIDINVRRLLYFDGTSFAFRDMESVSPGMVTEFQIETTIEDIHVWDITDIHNVREMETSLSGNVATFRTGTGSLKEFIVFSGGNFPGVHVVNENVPNQDLHASPQADMIIVTHPDFLAQAEELAALHREQDGLRILVATTTQVYNEFSSGVRDAGAIRNLMRMFYTRATNGYDLPKYLLLFGDGSFDNLSDHPGNTNYIPTWQSQNSLSPTRSFVSDDFYGLLDENEGSYTGFVDIGIGRFPVKTTEEAGIILEKIRQYTQPEARGDWRNSICFIGDDEDSNIHMRDANTLADYVETNYPAFNIDKIYLDAFHQETTSSGDRYPEVNLAISKRVQKGSLIVNYVGHGNERGLAHEQILGVADINNWKNSPRLPLFVTATCEFSRFDDVEREITGEVSPKSSAGEWILLNPEGGGIALLTTTRLVYSSPNFVLNQNFYKYIFSLNGTGKPNTLGDAIRYTKNVSGSGINKRNFLLLGDPALVLAYPKYRVVTDSLDHKPAGQTNDTLKALSLVHISGHLEDPGGNLLSSSGGTVMPVIYDKPRPVTTLANDGGQAMTFAVQDNILFKGKAGITNGHFSFSFRVPKDIAYNAGYGKLGYYGTFDSTDAAGSFQQIIVGGFSNETITDTDGPDIRLYLNDTLFVNEGIAGRDVVLLARISDPSGINTTGNGIGHDLVAVIDEDYTNPVVLNSYFEYDLNSYQAGNAYFPVFDLSPGHHTIRVKAWDNLNNSSEATLGFQVLQETAGTISSPIAFPNPFSSHTYITFEHNIPGSKLDMEIRIYRFDGTLVRILKSSIPSTGFRIPPVLWDGRDDNGQKVSAGIYVFRVFVRSDNYSFVSPGQKMIKIKF